MTFAPVRRSYQKNKNLVDEQATTNSALFPPPPPPTELRKDVSEAEEQDITRKVLILLAELHPVTVRDGRIVVPDDATEELANRIRAVEGELLWALGKESGPRWGCSWVPALPPEPPRVKGKTRNRRQPLGKT